jgi:hypothetical protein
MSKKGITGLSYLRLRLTLIAQKITLGRAFRTQIRFLCSQFILPRWVQKAHSCFSYPNWSNEIFLLKVKFDVIEIEMIANVIRL